MRTSGVLALIFFAVTAACGTSAADGSLSGPEFVIGDNDAGSDAALDVASPPDAGAEPSDAGGPPTLDVVVSEVGDAGGGTDSGPGPDTDAGVCEPGSTVCDGDILLTCSDDGLALGRTRCGGRGLVCVQTDAGAACAEPEPVPTECTAFDAEVLSPGGYRFDLCAAAARTAHIDQGDCGSGGASSGAERVFTFTLAEETEVLLDLRDEDDEAAIDTILYLRADCDDPRSQVACSDDIPCDQSDVELGACDRGLQVRQSRIERRLAAGSYTLFADHLVYRGFGCGTVELRVDW